MDLDERMMVYAEAHGLPVDDPMRTLAESLSIAASMLLTGGAVDRIRFLGCWERARKHWCEVTGEGVPDAQRQRLEVKAVLLGQEGGAVITPKASGTLLARCTDDGRPRVSTVISGAYADGKQRLTYHQYRLIPGHSKMVPLELVTALADVIMTNVNFIDESARPAIANAITAAVKGAV
jgi:head-tail adaptor